MSRPEKKPLHSVEAEQALLGGLMLNNQSFYMVQDKVQPADFFDQLHQEIAATMWAAMEKGHGATPITLATSLPADEEIAKGVTLRSYLARLAQAGTSLHHLPDMARIVAHFASRRKMAEALARAEERIRNAGTDEALEDILDDIESPFYEIRDAVSTTSYSWLWEAAARAVADTMAAKDGKLAGGMTSGIACLDGMLGTMLPGDVVVIAAPSGAGKTALATQIQTFPGNYRTEEVRPSLQIQMEMEGAGIARRIMTAMGAPSVRMQKSGKVNEGQLDRLIAASKELQSFPMIIDDSGKQSIRTVRARIRQMKHRWNIGSVVVDNFQLLADEYDGQHEMEKLQRAARQLKDIAKETHVVLIVLSQLTRGSQKEAKHWRFSDQAIYGGDALKQASDMMIALANPGDFIKDQLQAAETLGLNERMANLGTKYELWKGFVEIGGLKMREEEKAIWRKVAYNGATLTFSDP